jgi:uncharacterized membrane protein YedE/YeeE
MTKSATEVRPTKEQAAPNSVANGRRGPGLLVYSALGCLFGIVLIRSEVVSWFRIQEMFRFQSFHMYGIIISAIATAALSIMLLRRVGAQTLAGEAISIPPKALGRGYQYWIGGTLFGVGWALTGACPGPLFALAGSGMGVYAVAALSALAGTWLYGYLRPHLPH